MKKWFVIHNVGNFVQITKIIEVEEDKVADPSLYYESDSPALIERVEEVLKDSRIRFPVDLLTKKVRIKDLIIDQLGTVVLLKERARTNALSLIRSRLNAESFMDLFKIMMINNKLLDKGIYLTDDNREEKSLEIIESGDEALNNLLMEFYEAKENLSMFLHWYNEYKELMLHIDDAKETFKDKKEEGTVCKDLREKVKEFSLLFG